MDNAGLPPTPLEKYVLQSLDGTGWEPQMWFPRVLREHLNLPDAPSEHEIRDALLGLIRKGHVTVCDPAGSPVFVDDVSQESLDGLTLDLEPDARRRLDLARERSRKPPRGYFEVFAQGDANFDPDHYLSRSGLQFDRMWRRSDPDASGIGKRLGDCARIEHGLPRAFARGSERPLRTARLPVGALQSRSEPRPKGRGTPDSGLVFATEPEYEYSNEPSRDLMTHRLIRSTLS